MTRTKGKGRIKGMRIDIHLTFGSLQLFSRVCACARHQARIARGKGARRTVPPPLRSTEKNTCDQKYLNPTGLARRRLSSGLQICQKCIGGRGFAPDSTGGAHDAPPDLLVGWGGGHQSQCPTPFGASILAPSAL